MKIASAKDWQTVPLPEEYVELTFDLLLDQKQSDAVRRGLVPDDMGHRWFSYFENNVLYQFRSWSGFCVDEISFKDEGGLLRVVSAKVNRNRDQYDNADNDQDIWRITEMLTEFYPQDPYNY